MTALSKPVPAPTFAVPEDCTVDPEKVAAVQQELMAAGVEFCQSCYVDIHGIPKAKAVPIEALEKMARGSELFTVGAMEGMGLVGPQEDECAAVPDLDTAVICPWDKTTAMFFGTLYYHGKPYPNDSRVILKRQVERAAALGYTFNLGCETEFYVLDTSDGEAEPKLMPGVRFKGICPAYDCHQTNLSMPFLRPMVKAMNELGWGVYSFDQEGGHSQYEFDAKYADVLTTADRFVFLRLMAKHFASAIGMTASFMPKPFQDDFRSGSHFNMSLADAETGENAFAPGDNGHDTLARRYGMSFSDLAYHFAAGLLKHAGALTAVTCPTYNSYQGLIAQGDMLDISWAPVLVTYGRNNRSAMIRMPPNRYCVENRAPDMACNPYLAAAMTLAAGLEGIEQKLDPGEPLNSNCYDLSLDDLKARGVQTLPRTLLHALEAFEADPLVDAVFGEMKGIYLRQKMREWEEGFYPVTRQHRARRLTFI